MTQPAIDPKDTGYSSGAQALLIFGGLAAMLGVYMLSQATAGVGAIAMACFLGIGARVAQAGQQHRAIVRILRERHRV